MDLYLYKTNYNIKNRPISKDFICTKDYKVIQVPNQIYPDTPFILPADTANDIINNDYDYIRFEYNKYQYYAFLVSYEAITPKQKDNTYTYRIVHKIDAWTTFGYDHAWYTGIIERAHVNDYYIRNNLVIPSLKYTYNEAEIEMLSGDLVTCQESLLDLAIVKPDSDNTFLYILYNKSTLPSQKFEIATGELKDNNYFGLNLLVMGYKKSNGQILPIYADDVLINANNNMNLNDLTSSNIVSMFFSDISPAVNVTIQNDHLLVSGIGEEIVRGNVIPVNETEGSPQAYLSPILQLEAYLNTSYSEARNYLDYNYTYRYGTTLQLSPDNIFASVKNYLDYGITKLHTSAYLPVLLVKDKSVVLNSTEISGSMHIRFDPYLYNYYVYVPTNIEKKLAQYEVFLITSQFLPFNTNDYWTKLNAQASIANSEFNGVKHFVGAIKDVIGGAYGASAQSAKGNYIASAGTVATTAVGGVQNAITVLQDSYNISVNKAINTRLINEGIKNLNSPNFGQIFVYADAPQFVTHSYKDISVLERYAHILNMYGYETNIPLDGYFSKHLRRYFNFVKCREVTVGGIPYKYAQEIQDMFLNGVTFWRSSTTPAMDYNHINRQINESEDAI